MFHSGALRVRCLMGGHLETTITIFTIVLLSNLMSETMNREMCFLNCAHVS